MPIKMPNLGLVNAPPAFAGMPILALLLLFMAAACSDTEANRVQLLEVEPPPGLDQLDSAVRVQFDASWRLVRELTAASRQDRKQLGAAWGALGQWFDVYKYPDSAASCYRNARQLAPQEPRWPYYLALLAVDAGDFETAQDGFEAAAELAPAAAAPRVRLGDLALRLQQLDRAAAHYRHVIARHPDDPGALLGLGHVSLLRGDPATAVKTLEAVVSKQSDASEALYLLGLAWRQLGEAQRAAEYLQQVREENMDQIPLQRDDPWQMELHLLDSSVINLTRRGLRAYRRGNYVEAAVLAGRAVSSDANNAELRVNYAAALLKTGRLAAALEQLKASLEIDPQHARTYLVLGSVYLSEGRSNTAEKHLATALSFDPQLVEARLQLGRAYQRQGKLEQALAQYAKVRDPGRSLAGTRFWHAALLTVLGRVDAARKAIADDLRLLPDDRQLLLLQARLLATAGGEAKSDAAQAHRLVAADTAAPDVFYAETVAMVAAGQGDFATAVAWQSAAVTALGGVRPRSAAQIARRRLVLYKRGDACRSPWERSEILVFKPVHAPQN